MRTGIALLIVTTLTGLTSCGGTGPRPPESQTTIQGRAMQAMLADIQQVRSFVYGAGSKDDAERAATDLASWSRRMAELFPPGQASQDYVDMSPERARGAPASMIRTADGLLASVRTGRRTAVGDRLAQTERDGCGACHLSGTR